MINVTIKDNYHLRISRVLQEGRSHHLDVVLFLPVELGLTTNLMTEEAFYHRAFQIKRTYYSERHRLPLVMSRLAGARLDVDQFRLGLSLYAHQYVLALEEASRSLLEQARALRKRVRRLARKPEEERTSEAQQAIEDARAALASQLKDTIMLSRGILRRMRRQRHEEGALRDHFVNIDNYLSWQTEQRLLAVAAQLPDDGALGAERSALLALCHSENVYREELRYNPPAVVDDPARISNRMRLLRLLIEQPVTLKQQQQTLGGVEQRMVKAVATAMVMVVVTLGLMRARELLGDVTAMFVSALALMYALREVFKDDLRSTMWRWLRRGRPRWRRHYRDPNSKTPVGRQLEWFDYRGVDALDAELRRMRGGGAEWRGETVLHYRSRSKMSPTRFLSGYDKTRENLTLDLSPIIKLMVGANQRVYGVDSKERITQELVERNHMVQLVVRDRESDGSCVIQRWKVVVNRSGIMDLQLADETQ
ncbi:hypothetical protein [Halomonas halocynthiae]|uniref:hypothetical protein n=1 Tax=Halomonas halocynthiae TaxID=176290 RepID=UPI00041C764D|nr:hypothetical protein [Halomonas halocynthiae]